MAVSVMVVGCLIFVAGILILISPSMFRNFFHRFITKKWLVFATLFRIAVGILFIIEADRTRMPGFIKGLGIFTILAGLSIPVIGAEKVERIVTFFMNKPDSLFRVFGIFALCLGGALFWLGL
ncbi:MAG: hypothetical protein AB7T22_09115 [Calditrichaceae bacterium]